MEKSFLERVIQIENDLRTVANIANYSGHVPFHVYRKIKDLLDELKFVIDELNAEGNPNG